jgi:hypothetical protein
MKALTVTTGREKDRAGLDAVAGKAFPRRLYRLRSAVLEPVPLCQLG